MAAPLQVSAPESFPGSSGTRAQIIADIRPRLSWGLEQSLAMEGTTEALEKLASELGQCPRARLEEWLLEIAELNGELRGLIRWRAAAQLGHFDAQALRELIRNLTEIPADASWKASGPVGRRILWLPRLLKSALDCPAATGLPEAIEFALWRSEALVMAVQDSEYWSLDLDTSLLALHLEACQRFRPEPRALAERMAQLRQSSGIGWFDAWPAGYEEVLGPDGLSEWRRHKNATER